MNRIYRETYTGRKNLGFGIALFLILGVGAGIPLTIDFFGGTIFSSAQYQAWKVVHAYGVFLGFVNFFFGLLIDRLDLAKRQKEISSWSFLAAGIIGGIARMVLLLFSALDEFGLYASLGETVCFVLGTTAFLYGVLRVSSTGRMKPVEGESDARTFDPRSTPAARSR